MENIKNNVLACLEEVEKCGFVGKQGQQIKEHAGFQELVRMARNAADLISSEEACIKTYNISKLRYDHLGMFTELKELVEVGYTSVLETDHYQLLMKSGEKNMYALILRHEVISGKISFIHQEVSSMLYICESFPELYQYLKEALANEEI